jgi:hypothetical protein
MYIDPGTLDVTDKIVRIFGWPALLGGLVWLVRTYDKGLVQLKNINEDTKEARRLSMETHGAVNTMQTNHLTHIAEDIKAVNTVQSKQLEALNSIDRGIGILVDRKPTSIETVTRIVDR